MSAPNVLDSIEFHERNHVGSWRGCMKQPCVELRPAIVAAVSKFEDGTSAAGSVGGRPKQDALAAIREIHKPVTEEAEVWLDGTGSELHADFFPDCTDCEGHEVKVQVCSECGYDHDGDTALYRQWSCPTVRALDSAAGRGELTDQLADALREMVDSVDPEEGAEIWDLSTCPYYRRGLPGADPEGTCGFSCVDEPECQTCHPSDGYPLEKARAVLVSYEAQKDNAP